jgi:beta-mannosidase
MIATDLSGPWSFTYANAAPVARTCAELEAAGLAFLPCAVPGNFELDLQAQGRIPDPFFGLNMLQTQWTERCHIWYVRAFSGVEGEHIELYFEGIDTFAEIYLNGEWLGATDNALIEHVFDVTGKLHAENELLVHLQPVAEGIAGIPESPDVGCWAFNREMPYTRKAAHAFGWDIMPRAVSAGLWRPVSLRVRPEERIEETYLRTERLERDRAVASLYCTVTAGTDCTLRVEGRCGEHAFSANFPADNASHTFEIADPRLWWPDGYGDAHLYQVTVTLLRGAAVLDARTFAYGIRTVELTRTDALIDGEGDFCFVVNGVRIYAKGTNWVPLDAYHSRDLGRLDTALALAAACHCNMIRCWGGNVYEHDRFFDYCDAHGILVWQDFAMACATYPQDAAFQARLAAEARATVRRLRQHPCLAIWVGDNECDWSYEWFQQGDPNRNVLTRATLPGVLREEDPGRPYLPSSPYLNPTIRELGEGALVETHLWGPRDYYKSDFYLSAQARFTSEIGYHGCPSPSSLPRFLSPEKIWPYADNKEWQLHSTDPTLASQFAYRVELMAQQIRALFGTAPEELAPYALASQIVQAEAKKFFIERFRGDKGRRTGLLWWNLLDGWPQFSDAVVDYYFEEKLAFSYITRSQQHCCALLREPEAGRQQLVAVNDTLRDLPLQYRIRDIDTLDLLAAGEATVPANGLAELAEIPADGAQRFYLLDWESPLGRGRNHYLAGTPPFDLAQYAGWLRVAGWLPGWAGAGESTYRS